MSKACPIKNKKELKKFEDYYLEKGDLRNYCLIILGLNTALRISDILNLKWKDVYNSSKNRPRKHIELVEQKTQKTSKIAVNAALNKALRQYHDYCQKQKELPNPNAFLFTSTRNSQAHLCRSQAYRIIRCAAEAAGIEDHISCHSLRKTFGYYAWKQGTSPAVLMNIYNHSSYHITQMYLGIDQDDRDAVFLKMIL